MSISYAASVVVANPFLVVKADVHPIVEVQSGYLFGATINSKWIKSEEAAKAISDERTYKIYGLTQSLGEANGAKPKPSEEEVCSDVLTVSLSSTPEKGVIALAAHLIPFAYAKAREGRNRAGRSVECATAKTTSDRSNQKNLCGCSARIFANKGNRPTESED